MLFYRFRLNMAISCAKFKVINKKNELHNPIQDHGATLELY